MQHFNRQQSGRTVHAELFGSELDILQDVRISEGRNEMLIGQIRYVHRGKMHGKLLFLLITKKDFVIYCFKLY